MRLNVLLVISLLVPSQACFGWCFRSKDIQEKVLVQNAEVELKETSREFPNNMISVSPRADLPVATTEPEITISSTALVTEQDSEVFSVSDNGDQASADGLQNVNNPVLAAFFTSAKSNLRVADMRPTGDEIVIQREGSHSRTETPDHDFVDLRDTIDELLDAEWDKVL